MKSIERIFLAGILVIMAGIVVHAPLSVGLGVLFPDYSPLIKSWKEILLVLLSIVGIVVVTKRGLWRELSRDWVFRLVVAYALLHIVLVMVLWRGVDSTAAGLAIDLRFILFFGLTYVLIRARPDYKKPILLTSLVGASVVVFFSVLQIFVLPADILSHLGYSKETIAPYLTVDKNPDYIRINSTLRGPNPLGAYAAIVIAVIAAYVVLTKRNHERKLRLYLWVVAVAAVLALWASYSRSAAIAAAVSLGIISAATVARQLSRRTWIVLSALIFAVAGGFIIGRDSSFVAQVILHENPTGGSAVSSNDEHLLSLEGGLQTMLRQPFGTGVGSTGSASLYGDSPRIIENHYLFVAHEAGWLGLLLFLAIFGLIMWRLWLHRTDWLSLGLFASGVGLAIIGLLLPVWVDDTVAIVWWGLAAVALGGMYGKKRTSK